MASNLFVYNVSPPTITINQIDWGGNPITCDSLCPCTPGDNSTYTIPSTGTFNLEFHVSNGVLNGCITVTDSLGLIQNQDIANTYSGIVTFATVTYDGITDIQVVINDNLCAPIPTPTETPTVSPSPTPTPTYSQYSVTSFGYGSASAACASSTNTVIYASPGSTDPIVGMIFYADSTLTTPYVGNGSGVWLLLEQNSNKWAVQIDTNGELLDKSDCALLPTTTPTPSVTPPPCDCNYLYLNVSQLDLDDATGNTDTNLNGRVFIDFTDCNSNPAQYSAIVAGIINTTLCYLTSQFVSAVYYYKNDTQLLATFSSYYPNGCCSVVTPTPTETSTATPPVTPSPTATPPVTPSPTPSVTPPVTPTTTQTPTQTEPYDVYLFQDCCDLTNFFRYENVPGILVVGNTYGISGGVGFNGCATVQVYSATGTVYNGSGIGFTNYGPSSCASCISIIPCPTPTPTQTQTQTQTPSNSPTQTQTPTTTPTTTTTPTDTPDPTPTQTQTPVVPTVMCYSATTTGTTWSYHDCCGDFIAGTDTGLAICVDTLLPYNGINVTTSSCISPVCYSAATLADCCTGEIFFALVDQTTADGNAAYGVVYRFNERSYYFIRFGGPGGPYVGLPDYGSCEKANEAYPCLTPTPTVTQSPYQTPTITPTPSITPPHCESTDFCLTTQFSGISEYNGTYTQYTTYNTKNAYSGDGITVGYIFYTGSYWCLSSSLGGSCILQGASPCYSVCPDISGEIFTTGICPTPTPTPADCSTLNFLAYFDCDYEPLPTPTPSVPCSLVNFDMTGIGVTPTPTQTGPACQTFLDFSLSGYTLPPTPTVTASPTITLTRTVAADGRVTFTLLDDTFACTTVRVLQDCTTGQEYLTSQALFYSGSTGQIPITSGITMLAMIDGSPVCVDYITDRKGSSTSIVEEVIALYSECDYCNPVVTPTQTVTATNTQTPTPTPGVTPTQTATPTLSPTNTASPSPTPSMTASPGSDPSPTPSETATQTPTPSVTVTMTPSNTPTYTMTPTPSPTSVWVYVYESCTEVPSKLPRKMQVIQTQPVTFIANEGRTFKNSDGICWKYVGQFNTNYIAPLGIDSVTYTGNYFVNAINYVYQSCNECLAVLDVDPCVNYVYYTATRCDNSESVSCVDCELYVNNTFGVLDINYQSCEGTWYYNELIQPNQSVCIVPQTGGGVDWATMQYQSPNCGKYCISSTPTQTTIYAKACDIIIDLSINFFELGISGTQTSRTSTAPTVGQVVTITSYDTNNTITDQFCATITSIIPQVQTTNIAASALFGQSYTCNTCPIYNRYTISTCNNDDSQVTNFPLYVPYTVDLLSVGDVVSVNENANCFTVVTYEGLITDAYLSVLLTNSLAYSFESKYQDCNGCFEGQSPIIEEGVQNGTDPYIAEDNRGGSGSDTLYISNNLQSPERGREYLINYAESDTQNNLQ